MNSLFPLRYRRVLWGTAIAACLFSGFVVMLTKVPVRSPEAARGALSLRPAAVSHVAQGLHSNPAAFPAKSAEPSLIEAYGRLPLNFEINKGQTDSQVKFLSRGSGYSLFLTGSEAVLALRKSSRQPKVEGRTGVAMGSADLAFRSAAFPGLLRSQAAQPRTNSRTADPRAGSALRELALLPTAEQLRESFAAHEGTPVPSPESLAPAVLRMKLVGANPQAKVTGLEELPGKSNYFMGNDPKKWRTNVPNYAKVKYAKVYPGVDLVYYGNQGNLEYDFVVSPGANPGRIVLELQTDQSKIQNPTSTRMAIWWWAPTAAK